VLIKYIFASIILVVPIAGATTSCITPESRYEDIGCASAQLEAADKQLNQTYQALLSSQKQDAKPKLVNSQRAWVTFRDSDKAFVLANSGEGGSLGGLIALNHALNLTIAREKQLNDFLNATSK
jgi:uncharacterized protein YecT (DUF1311 family)